MDATETQQLLAKTLEHIRSSQVGTTGSKIDQRSFAVLTAIFPTVLNASLEILDNGKVTRFVTKDARREFYRVKEVSKQHEKNSGQVYDVVDDFCFCYFYARECLDHKGSSILCKHGLASHLARALGESHTDKLTVKEIEDQDFATLLLSSRDFLVKHETRAKSTISSVYGNA